MNGLFAELFIWSLACVVLGLVTGFSIAKATQAKGEAKDDKSEKVPKNESQVMTELKVVRDHIRDTTDAKCGNCNRAIDVEVDSRGEIINPSDCPYCNAHFISMLICRIVKREGDENDEV